MTKMAKLKQRGLLLLAFLISMFSPCSSYVERKQEAAAEVGIAKLEEVFAWNQITYNISGNPLVANRFYGPVRGDNEDWSFPKDDKYSPPASAKAGNTSILEEEEAEYFIQYNNLPMGLDRWRDKIFIAVPRRRLGIPSTLNYVSLTKDRKPDNKSPPLRPYPNLAANTLTSEKPLVNVYRPRVDACDRLWMVDTGRVENPGSKSRIIQPPAIVIYDLKTDSLFKRYELKADDMINLEPTGFISITVDVSTDDCGSAYAYLVDLVNYGLVVYSLKDNDSWRVYHNYFFLDPEDGDFDVAGHKYQWNDGVFSVALGPTQYDGFRTVYFHAMASVRERSVSSHVLRNKTLATRAYHGDDFKVVGERGRTGQSNIHGIHLPTNVMFLNQVSKSALACWNIKKPMDRNNIAIVAEDTTNFIYPSDMKIVDDDVWIMSNKLPVFLYGQLDTNAVNFRIYRTSVKSAIAGTVCDQN